MYLCFFAASARDNRIGWQIVVVLIILSIVVQLRAIRTRCAVAFLELLNESMKDVARDYFDAAAN